MSPDELLITAAAVVVGPVLWSVWLFNMTQLEMLGKRSTPIGVLASTLVASGVLIFVVLKTGASSDVVNDPLYLFMYVVAGLAWTRVVAFTFPYAGLSLRDDVFERGNKAAVPATVGALLGVTFCYAGGNVGDGPGWWVVGFCAAIATLTLLALWLALTQLTPVADSVAVDRDPAAGLRLGSFLVSCGLVLGRAVAGNWHSAARTMVDFVSYLPYAALVLIVAAIVEGRARPTPQRPQAPFVQFGIVPSLLYLIIAAGALAITGRPT